MTAPAPRPVVALAALILLASGAAAQEAGGARADAAMPPFQAFSSTNVQLLQGWNWDDPLYFTDGRLTTVTLNHFSTWEYGDNFAFADFYSGDFKNGFDPAHPDAGLEHKLYGEWHPRLFVNRLLGQERPVLGVVRNWGLAGELNASEGFAAYLAGVGVDLAVPGFAVLGLNAYYRWDSALSGHHDQWQVSPFWTIDLPLFPTIPIRFTGFVDLNGTWDFADDESFVEVWAQPELLVDVLAPFGGKRDRLWVGGEWFYHRHPVGTSSVPQLMVQWTVY
jgi:nucleoside-specific outer membrane channel protein Tsx